MSQFSSKETKTTEKKEKASETESKDEKSTPSPQVNALVRRRIKELMKVQEEITNEEIKLHNKIYELELQYLHQKDDLYEKRRVILNGEYEPTEEDFDCSTYEVEDCMTVAKENRNWGVILTKSDEITFYPRYEESTKGIPNFWLRVFYHSRLADFIEVYDEPVLSHLQDIRIKFSKCPRGYTVKFYFSENEYFTNKILTKHYDVRIKPKITPFFRFDGPETFRSEGCQINWNKGKDVTVVKKIRKDIHVSRQHQKITKMKVRRNSFFDYFTNSFCTEECEEGAYNATQFIMLESDFEIGIYIRERIIPKAYLYFTGEIYEREIIMDEPFTTAFANELTAKVFTSGKVATGSTSSKAPKGSNYKVATEYTSDKGAEGSTSDKGAKGSTSDKGAKGSTSDKLTTSSTSDKLTTSFTSDKVGTDSTSDKGAIAFTTDDTSSTARTTIDSEDQG